jgi:deoxycytidylate deaminase
MKVEPFLRKAEEMANISDYHNQHVGCVVTLKNRIISAGCNSNKTHPVQRKYNRLRFDNSEGYSPDSLHAEIHALVQVAHMNIDWSKVTVFIYRKMKSRKCGLARPCPSCMAYIKALGIKNIVYTTNDGYAIEKLTEMEKAEA